MKEAGVDFISTCIDLNGMKTLAQELERQGMDDVVAATTRTPTTRRSSPRPATCSRATSSACSSARSRPTRGHRRSTTSTSGWTSTGSEPTELAMVGWINATSPSRACSPPGPEFDRDKVDRRHQRHDRLHRRRAHRADRLDRRPTTPVHRRRPATPTTSTECTALVQVEDGEFVTVGADRTKPWLCWDRRRPRAGPSPSRPTSTDRGRSPADDARRLDRRGPLPGGPAGARRPGTVYALIALGFVLTYKTSGVFNLAFGAQAYVSAAMYFHAQRRVGVGDPAGLRRCRWSCWPRALGLVLERLIFRHLRTGSSVAKLVVAIGLSVALPACSTLIVGFEAVAGRTPKGIVPDGATRVLRPVRRLRLQPRRAGGDGRRGRRHASASAALFRFTAIGLQMRAVVESPRMTELNGIRADRVSAFSWALSSLFAGLAGVLIAPRFNTLAAPDFFNLVVVAIAAAAVGRLVSLPAGARSAASGSASSSPSSTRSCPRWADDYALARADPGEPHPGDAVRRAVRRARARGRRSGGPARPPTRWPASTRRRRRWPPPTRSRRAHPRHPGLRRRASSSSSASSCSPRPTRRGCSSSPRP